MTPEIDSGLFGKTLDWIVAGMAALLAAIYKFHRGQITEIKQMVDGLSAAISSKADSTETNRQREHIEQIFKRLGAIDVATGRIEEQIKSLGRSLDRLVSHGNLR